MIDRLSGSTKVVHGRRYAFEGCRRHLLTLDRYAWIGAAWHGMAQQGTEGKILLVV